MPLACRFMKRPAKGLGRALGAASNTAAALAIWVWG